MCTLIEHTACHIKAQHLIQHEADKQVYPWTWLDMGIGQSYLIFVISFTLAGFLNTNILHPKITKNNQKLQQIAPKSVKYAVFSVQSGNFYTRQNLFTQAPPVVPVTNMRYEWALCFWWWLHSHQDYKIQVFVNQQLTTESWLMIENWPRRQ